MRDMAGSPTSECEQLREASEHIKGFTTSEWEHWQLSDALEHLPESATIEWKQWQLGEVLEHLPESPKIEWKQWHLRECLRHTFSQVNYLKDYKLDRDGCICYTIRATNCAELVASAGQGFATAPTHESRPMSPEYESTDWSIDNPYDEYKKSLMRDVLDAMGRFERRFAEIQWGRRLMAIVSSLCSVFPHVQPTLKICVTINRMVSLEDTKQDMVCLEGTKTDLFHTENTDNKREYMRGIQHSALFGDLLHQAKGQYVERVAENASRDDLVAWKNQPTRIEDCSSNPVLQMLQAIGGWLSCREKQKIQVDIVRDSLEQKQQVNIPCDARGQKRRKLT